jgi:hypothetical protein
MLCAPLDTVSRTASTGLADDPFPDEVRPAERLPLVRRRLACDRFACERLACDRFACDRFAWLRLLPCDRFAGCDRLPDDFDLFEPLLLAESERERVLVAMLPLLLRERVSAPLPRRPCINRDFGLLRIQRGYARTEDLDGEGREMATRTTSRSGNGKTGSAKRSSGASGSAARRANATRGNGNGVVATLKSAANRAGGPAVAVGAAAVGVAGGLVLRRRKRRRKVLGMTWADLDVQSILKSVGKASKQFGQTSKTVSKDVERLGDEAERIGKILS